MCYYIFYYAINMAASNNYFHYLLISRLFSWLTDEIYETFKRWKLITDVPDPKVTSWIWFIFQLNVQIPKTLHCLALNKRSKSLYLRSWSQQVFENNYLLLVIKIGLIMAITSAGIIKHFILGFFCLVNDRWRMFLSGRFEFTPMPARFSNFLLPV